MGAASETLDLMEQTLKPDICNAINWCDYNKMSFNYDKIEAILITTSQTLCRLNITVKIKALENVKQEK